MSITYYFKDTVDDKGRHEVHKRTCTFVPSINNRTEIGVYSSCRDAVAAAKVAYPWKSFDGCFWCCRECHTG